MLFFLRVTEHESRITGLHTCLIIDLGLIRYAAAVTMQERVVTARKAGAIGDVLLLCEHPHVITLGRNGNRENLLASENVLKQKGVELHETNRGGDITYHGPGQLVGYPILDLGAIRKDVRWYVRALEEAMIRATSEFGIAGGREGGKIGVWVGEPGRSEKLAAIGVHLSRWVTSHGFAYNVSTDLRYFDLMVPCGIAGRNATSLEKLLGRAVNREEAAEKITRNLGEVFGREMKNTSPQHFSEQLESSALLEQA